MRAADSRRHPRARVTRRAAVARVLIAGVLLAAPTHRAAAIEPAHPQRRWQLEAQRMRALALSWGDQPYGAVVVVGDAVVGLGPSRVVKDGDPDAHAERVAIAAAQRALGRERLADAVLYSTSHPCAACERAAARAGVMRMYYGDHSRDAGVPLAR